MDWLCWVAVKRNQSCNTSWRAPGKGGAESGMFCLNSFQTGKRCEENTLLRNRVLLPEHSRGLLPDVSEISSQNAVQPMVIPAGTSGSWFSKTSGGAKAGKHQWVRTSATKNGMMLQKPLTAPPVHYGIYWLHSRVPA